MKCNAEHVRGQKDRGDKYQTLLSKDANALAFHCKHAKGSKAAKMMLAIKQKAGQLQRQLRDTDSAGCPAILRILGPAPKPHSSGEEKPPVKFLGSAASADFERPDTEAPGAQDDRGAQKMLHKARYSSTPSATPALLGPAKALGANLKVARELRKFLVALGFKGSRDLAELPEYSDLRRAYKHVLLVVHPDKAPRGTAMRASPASGEAAMDFHQLQESYQDLLARYYDPDAQNFNAEVKAHRKSQKAKEGIPRAKAKITKVENGTRIREKG